ncbi:hypothetical protein BH23CHL2_BH23CHL2_20150 [soil metagenome]
MGRRNCASCRFYERSSIARMGWCRQPELYAPHQNHLVAADDLDCDRGTGDFWESHEPANNQAKHLLDSSGKPSIVSITSTGSPVFPVSGSSGYSDDPPPVPGGGGNSGGPSWGNGDRDFNYYEEERYWTDYLRIAAPVLGVILLVVLLWFWIASFLGDDDDPDDAAAATATIELPTFSSSPDATEDGAITPSPPAIAPTPIPGSPTATPQDAPTTDPGGGNGQTGIYLGATVEVANTDGAGVNVRAEPTTGSDVLTIFLDGTQIQVIDGPVEAEDFTWWQITGNEVAAGWIVEEYLIVIE